MDLVDENTITDIAMRRWATAKNPRLAKIMPALIKHLHAFAREVELTPEEWMAGIQWLTAVGQISDDKRMEGILASDVFGLSMLVVMMNARTPTGATPNTVLGPFHIDGSPEMPKDADMSEGIEGEKLYVSGVVRGLDGKPIANAVLDVWQADTEGAYEAQIPGAEERLRAIFRTDQEGRYGLWTIAPKGYAIPMDGPVGQLIGQTDISYYRPSHFHAMVLAPGYQPLITHLFREGAPYLENDVVFGVREPLITPFRKHEPGAAPGGRKLDEPWYTAQYDFVLAPAA
ncbi:MAG: dioxygenase family protein [Caulobacteraceae bacterium]